MIYRIIFAEETKKFFRKHPKLESKKIIKNLTLLAQDPYAPNNNIVKLSGTHSSYRLRVGDIRAVYELSPRTKTITVARIAPRSSIYKK